MKTTGSLDSLRGSAGRRLLPLDAGPGPARPITRRQAQAIVRAGLAASQSVPGLRGWRTVAALAAAALAGAAAAAVYIGAVRSDAPAAASDPGGSPGVVPTGPATAPSRAPGRPPVQPSAPVEAPAAPEVRPFEPQHPAEPATGGPAGVTMQREPPSGRRPPRGADAPAVGAPPVPSTPVDLLRAANELRRQRRWNEAAKLYGEVAAAFPGTEEAYAATVAAAELALDQLGQPAAALSSYRSALRQRPRGYLAEEAAYGIARAHRALGDAAAETEALRSYLVAHPDGLQRKEAELRLRVLGAPTNGGSR